MDVVKLLSPDTITTDLRASTKEEAFDHLTRLLYEAGRIEDREAILRGLREREELGPTVLGHGVAIPHTRSTGLEGIAVAVGVIPAGLDYDSGEDAPIQIMVVIVASNQERGAHVVAVSQISRILHDDRIRTRVLHAESPDEVIQVFQQGSENLMAARGRNT